MKKVFSNANHVQCVFTDEGISFSGKQQEVFFPYGCLDSVKMSFFGVLQAACHKTIGSFTVDHKDRAAMKEMVQYACKAMTTAPKAELQIIDLTNHNGSNDIPEGLSEEEQLKHYKALFVQGTISKEEYEARKRQLKKD